MTAHELERAGEAMADAGRLERDAGANRARHLRSELLSQLHLHEAGSRDHGHGSLLRDQSRAALYNDRVLKRRKSRRSGAASRTGALERGPQAEASLDSA